MLLFAHTGITLEACSAAAALADKNRTSKWFLSLSKYADVRVLMVGSMLPDIIDKPVGQFLFRNTFSNGRIFSHTLLLLLLLASGGWLFWKMKRQAWLLTLAAGDFTHLLMDQMWLTPHTLFWPLMGTGFDHIELEGWLNGIFKAIVSNPQTYIPELLGLIILLWYLWVVLKRKQVGALIKTGRIS